MHASQLLIFYRFGWQAEALEVQIEMINSKREEAEMHNEERIMKEEEEREHRNQLQLQQQHLLRASVNHTSQHIKRETILHEDLAIPAAAAACACTIISL